jgi:hypothetical protein
MQKRNIRLLLVIVALHFPILWGEEWGGRLYAQFTVTHLEKPINTTGSETGALRLGDTVLVFSSMEHSSGKNSQFDVGGPVMQVFQARITRNGRIAKPHPDRWGLNNRRDHTGNIAFDPLTYDIYFTRGNIETLDCDIYFAKRKKRRGWDPPVKLPGPVNMQGYTSTHPAVARLADSTVILYFVSNRPGGLGGMDIWYTLVRNGKSSECINLGPLVNSSADELTPFYDQRNGVLYFSSDRPGGLGGYDIYCAIGQRNSWQQTEPVCHCLNSPENDLYFSITQYDSTSSQPLAGYLASNRSDSYFLTDSSCCNDLYLWTLDSSQWAVQREPLPDTLIIDTTTLNSHLITLNSFTFPLFLYFHNDEPDPQSRTTGTATTYTQCQRRYAALRGEYLSHQRNEADSAMMARFFDSCVVGNYNRVEELFDYVEALLDEGHSVTVTIAGFASPVYKDDYNRNLSHRRIASFINMVRAWRGGMFEEALESGRLILDQKPHGAVQPTTESRSTDPVYGLPAAMARRIEILDCEVK